MIRSTAVLAARRAVDRSAAVSREAVRLAEVEARRAEVAARVGNVDFCATLL